jgi:hypothetical protein
MMLATDDFRFKSHQLLLELDAATTEMMMLVTAKEMAGDRWALATERHGDAYAAWNVFVNQNGSPSLISSLTKFHAAPENSEMHFQPG